MRTTYAHLNRLEAHAMPTRFVCRSCGNTVTPHAERTVFVCPMHGDIPPTAVGKIFIHWERIVGDTTPRIA